VWLRESVIIDVISALSLKWENNKFQFMCRARGFKLPSKKYANQLIKLQAFNCSLLMTLKIEKRFNGRMSTGLSRALSFTHAQ
jgi:hypothetical protein